MSKNSTFTMNIGPGNVIGAMAVGAGASASGEVNLGKKPEKAPDALRVHCDITGASPTQTVAWLRQLIVSIEHGEVGPVAKSGSMGSVAWDVDKDT